MDCGAGPNGAGVAMWSMRCAVASKVGARERSQYRDEQNQWVVDDSIRLEAGLDAGDAIEL